MEDVSDLHHMPLVGHDLPSPITHVHRAKAWVFKGPESGLWYWEHACPRRGLQRPFHSLPAASQEAAFRLAHAHVEWCL